MILFLIVKLKNREKMNRNGIFGVIAVVVIIVAVIYFLPRAERSQVGNFSGQSAEVAQGYNSQLLISQQQKEINDLKLRIQECENRAAANSTNSNVVTNLGNGGMVSGSTGTNSGSLSMSGPIEMQVTGDMKVSGKLILTPTGQKTQTQRTVVTQAQKPVTQTVVVQAPPKPVTQTVVVQTPKASTELVFPSYFYEAGDKVAKYCIRVDSLASGHLPHLAINDGRISPDDPTILPNNDGGYDWISSTGLPEFVGAWGVVQNNGDFIFFVSAELIEYYLKPGSDCVEINAPATRNIYRKMTKFENYYVYYVK